MSVRDAVVRWWSDRRVARAYEALSPDERAGLAHDVGLSGDALGQIMARGARAGEELGRLLKALDIKEAEVASAQPDLLRDMRATCSSCAVVKQCRRHLRRGAARVIYHTYCPNAAALSDLEGRAWWRDIAKADGGCEVAKDSPPRAAGISMAG